MTDTVAFNYGGLEEKFSSYENSKTAILPVPFERTSSWIKGSRNGPRALIEASRHMELYDIDTDSEVYRTGIYTAPAVEEDRTSEMIQEVCRRNLDFLNDGKFPVTVGGEHTVSIGAVKAALKYSKDLTVLHMDAHADFRSEYEGDPYSHACVMSRVDELGADILSVGIRSMDSSEKQKLENKKPVFASDVFTKGDWEKKVLDGLKEKVFLDIDLDVFDPSVIPGTGTPEPGGLFFSHITGLVKKIAMEKDIVGLGIVELCPLKENRISEFAASLLIYKVLSFLHC